MEDLSRIRDASLKASTAVALWKLTGHMPNYAASVSKVKSFVEVALREAGREAEAEPLFASLPVADTDAQMPRHTGTRFDREGWRKTLEERTQRVISDNSRLPGEVKAAFTPISLGNEYLIGGGFDQLAWLDGRLFIGSHVQIEPGLRSCSAVWSHDESTRQATILPSLEVPDLQNFTGFVSSGGSLWMTSEGSGVTRFEPATAKTEKFTARDGVPTEHMRACTAGGGQIFCGGGQDDQGRLAAFDLKSQKWSAISREAAAGGLLKISGLAFAKNRLLVVEDMGQGASRFSIFSVADRTWSPALGNIESRLTPAVSGMTSVGQSATCLGDAEGFWIAGGTTLCFHDPQSQKTETVISSGQAMEGVITRMLDDGEYLWIATVSMERPGVSQVLASPRLYALHKPTRKITGFLRVPYNGPVNCLAASPDKLWLGIDTRHDSEVYLVELAKKVFFVVPAADTKPSTSKPAGAQ